MTDQARKAAEEIAYLLDHIDPRREITTPKAAMTDCAEIVRRNAPTIIAKHLPVSATAQAAAEKAAAKYLALYPYIYDGKQSAEAKAAQLSAFILSAIQSVTAGRDEVIAEMVEAASGLLGYVYEKYKVCTRDGLQCPHMRKLAAALAHAEKLLPREEERKE